MFRSYLACGNDRVWLRAGAGDRVDYTLIAAPLGLPKKKNYLLICTTFAGGNPLKYVDEAIE